MASGTMTNSSLLASTKANDWTDLINLIGTGIGPLITLFGEQATKQFVSMSMGWADTILLATGLIGIITIVVSAIRIGGPPWLKSLIGRSRESRASAEQEFLSSTSQEVCELWSGRGVVRVTDKTNDTKLLLILHSNPEYSNATPPTSHFAGVVSADEAYEQRLLTISPLLQNDETIKEIILGVPNITVNIRANILHANELRFWAFLGVLLQILILAFPAIATYDWKWLRKGIVVPSFAYGCFLAGSISVLIGILGCGHIIEGSTTEYKICKNPFEHRRVQRILRLQMKCTVGAQHFSSFAILNDSKDPVIRASTLNDRKYSFWAAACAFAAIAGFIVQFIGLGVLHWSATVFVLGSSLFMTGIRAWVRRGLAGEPLYALVLDDFELAWLALRTARDDWDKFLTPKAHRDLSLYPGDCRWGVLTGYFEPHLADGRLACDLAFYDDTRIATADDRFFAPRIILIEDRNYARQLIELSNQEFVLGFNPSLIEPLDQNNEVKAAVDLISAAPNIPLRSYGPLASKLAVAIEGVIEVLDYFSDEQWIQLKQGWTKPRHDCDWRIDVSERLGMKTSWIVRLGQRRDGGSLAQDLTAGLSLWIYSHMCGSASVDNIYYFTQTHPTLRLARKILNLGEPTSFLRIIGNSELSTLKELGRWIPAVQQQSVPCTTIAAYHGNEDGELLDSHDEYCRFRPIFGLYNSASIKMQVRRTADRSGYGTRTEAAFTFRSQADLTEKQDFIVIPDPAFNTIEITSALEVFSLFILSICICIENVGGETKEDGESKTNTFFTALAEKLVNSGLIREEGNRDSYSQALLYIIPAFARSGLLPR